MRRAAGVMLASAALAAATLSLGAQGPDEYRRLFQQFHLEMDAGRYDDALGTAGRLRALAEAPNGPLRSQRGLLAEAVLKQAQALQALARFQSSEELHRWCLTVDERDFGPEHPVVARDLESLARLQGAVGRYAEAEAAQQRALSIREKHLPSNHPDLAASIEHWATLCAEQARYAEAETLYRRALAIWEGRGQDERLELARVVNNLATLFHEQGRFADAEPLYRRALAIRTEKLPADDPALASTLSNLAALLMEHGRYAEAEEHYTRALAIDRKRADPQTLGLAATLNNLAALYSRQQRYAEAELLYDEALTIQRAGVAGDDPRLAGTLENLALVRIEQTRYAEAEELLKSSLSAREKHWGPRHPEVARSLSNLALAYRNQGRRDEARPLVDRAIEIQELAGTAPADRYQSYMLRARILIESGQSDEAEADLRRAMELAEQQRLQASGGEFERARTFGRFGDAFELMVALQAGRGNVPQAFEAVERGRARSLLDELELALLNANLEVGRPAAEREQLLEEELELKRKIASVERQYKNLPPTASREQRAALQGEWDAARAELFRHYSQRRSTSPIYRRLLSDQGNPLRLGQLRRRLIGDPGVVMLIYLVGEQSSYVLAIGPSDAGISPLEADEQVAHELGIEPGPITADALRPVLVNPRGDGVLQQLRDTRINESASRRLAAMWQLLIPSAVRESLVSGGVTRLIVVPDGGLALLPFEALVTRPGAEPQYLLDVGPPIQYGPSASVLYNLADPGRSAVRPAEESLLTVGNPDYPALAAAETRGGPSTVWDELSPYSRYVRLGGELGPLPGTQAESRLVIEVFQEKGLSGLRLEGPEATENNVRSHAPGRRMVHFACHGLVDELYGNYFGALALTPPKQQSDASDDGFLLLDEICQLKLDGCELAVLSACNTNCGPDQRGEGVWSLSRGFILAGCRRVVASNWRVEDESAAALVGDFCRTLANQPDQSSLDYAAALHEAKRRVRAQTKWQDPIFWAPFELIGPH